MKNQLLGRTTTYNKKSKNEGSNCQTTVIEGMIVHPYTKETVQQFLKDGAQFQAKKN